ncbi:type I polyketide synthase [Chondromyces crocatus]|uniref:Uncharacterized protein n=1 Tax=Chondromyces crocatus TaxID=52 RepID=A0A0K1E4U6_CHOCO|nr:type I polyketide synthase [Chondromyces crocatus]AKT35905.1 uncharacterized protein CMC5_000160 [Chondromyces crocatus]
MSEQGDDTTASDAGSAIAIIGMSGQFPGAESVEQLWRNVREGIESIVQLEDAELLAAGVDPSDPRHVRAHGRLDGAERFDAAFFGVSPREAELLDPQHRLLLEHAWAALEDAGYDPDRVRGAIGLYAGSGSDGYLRHHVTPSGRLGVGLDELAALLANERDHLATRVAYKLDLRGPALTIQTACSTSLVAVQLACQALLAYQCDLALAGGVSITFPYNAGYLHQQGGILSPDGKCRVFDARGQGTVNGDGVGLVVLKRLDEAIADGDTIRAVILGAAINNDGAHKVGFTAPSADGQAEVIAMAHAMAGIDVSTIGYVEAHGTGTPMGDPIEVDALNRAFRRGTQRQGFCALGSIKANIGHLAAAAGVASLIKATFALQHGEIPPSLHFERPNPELPLKGSPFFVTAVRTPWPVESRPRRAGVSSFGFGGTNAHVVLEEPPTSPSDAPSPRPAALLLLSARSEEALDAASQRLATHLAHPPHARQPALADVAFTLHAGRHAFAHRRALVARDTEAAIAALRAGDTLTGEARADRRVAFLFPGQGAQRVGMGRALYQVEPTFRATVDACSDRLRAHLGLDLRALFDPAHATTDSLPTDAALQRTALAQPALFTLELALAHLWMSWGVEPEAMLGHSVGEYVAAHLAGVFPLDDALALVAARGRVIDALPAGAMLAVGLDEPTLAPLVQAPLAIAAVNAPSACVVSGPEEAIASLERRLSDRGLSTRRLAVSHAFHSAMMDPAVEGFADEVRKRRRHPPRLRFVSSVTGTWITPAQAQDPAYWARHLRDTVRFSRGVMTLLEDPDRILLEVGPGRTLTALVTQHRASTPDLLAVESLPRTGREDSADVEEMLEALGKLWIAGVSVDTGGVYEHERRRRVPLPTYPFERHRAWIDAPRATNRHAAAGPTAPHAATDPHHPVTAPAHPAARSAALPRMARTVRVEPGWVDAPPPAPVPLSSLRETVWWLLGDDGTTAALGGELRAHGAEVIAVERPESLLAHAQATMRRHPSTPHRLGLVSWEAFPGAPGVPASPDAALLAGLSATLPRELPDAVVLHVDLATDMGHDLPLVTRLAAELAAAREEPRVALRGPRRLVPRAPRATPPLSEIHRPPTSAPRSTDGAFLVLDDDDGSGALLARWLAGAAETAGTKVALLTPPPRPTPRDATSALALAEARLRDTLTLHLPEDQPGLIPAMHALCTAYITRYFLRGGVPLRTGEAISRAELRQRLDVQPRFHRLLDAMLDALREDGLVRFEGDVIVPCRDGSELPDPELLQRSFDEAHPGFRGTARLLSHCAQRYPDALSGRVEAISVLYPDGDSAFLDGCERDTVEHRSERLYTLLLREAVVRLIAARDPHAGPVRLLEVGAGRGLLTWPLAAALADLDVEIHVTDLGRTFVEDARREAARRGLDRRMRFGVLDISGEPAAQGYATHTFDLVVALNVVHAARDVHVALRHLARLLHPAGMLAMVEVVRAARWDTLTWGLAEGWWLYDDDLRRGSPMLSLDTWETALHRAGLTATLALPAGGGRQRSDHGLLLARATSPALPTVEAPGALRRSEAQRAGVVQLDADLSVSGALASAWRAAEARVGPIRRVIDASGPPPRTRPTSLLVEELADVSARIQTERGALTALQEEVSRHAVDVCVLLSAPPDTGRFGHAAAAARQGLCDAIAADRAHQVPLPSLASPHVMAFQAPGAGQPSGHPTRWISLAWDPAVEQETHGLALLRDAITAGTPLQIATRHIAPLDAPTDPPLDAPFGSSTAQNPARPPPDVASSPPERRDVTPKHRRSPRAAPYVAPRDATEQAIAAICRDLLGVERIGVHDDFIDLGADSLIMLRLSDRMRRDLGWKVPPEAVFKGSTIERLARAIEQVPAAPASPLVPLQPLGTKRPIYFAHPTSGVVFPYIELARRLGDDQPVYGLQAIGLDGEGLPDTTIEAMARHYVEAIRTRQPRGPYRVGGYSFGCLVAYEMAQQLRDVGETVDLLVLIDEPAPIQEHRSWSLTLTKFAANGLSRALWPHLHDYAYLRVASTVDDAAAAEKPSALGGALRSFIARSALASILPADSQLLTLRQPAVEPMFRLFMLHLRASLDYRPRAYPGRVILFSTNKASRQPGQDPEQGWGLLAAGGVEVHAIPGHHLTTLRSPHVEILAGKLRAYLDSTQSDSTQTSMPAAR